MILSILKYPGKRMKRGVTFASCSVICKYVGNCRIKTEKGKNRPLLVSYQLQYFCIYFPCYSEIILFQPHHFQLRQQLYTLPLRVSKSLGRVLNQRSFEACELVVLMKDMTISKSPNHDHPNHHDNSQILLYLPIIWSTQSCAAK